MRIVKIHINEFGPLVNKDFEFDENLTIVKGDNESGKSSLMLFIKFVLYGLSKKAKAGAVSEIERALSHSTKSASGYMIVSKDGTQYRIDRQARRSGKSIPERVQLTEAESGLVCEYSGSPGEFLLGIPAEVFENSSSISQLGCTTVGGKELGTAIKNLLSSADESIDSEKALSSLENVRKSLLYKNGKGGSIFNLTTRRDELSSQYSKAIEDSCETERIEAEIKKTEEKIEEVSAKQKLADELVARIGLCTVVKQFDRLHEYESEKKALEEKLEDIKCKTHKGSLSLDRAFVSTLKATVGELSFAYKDKCDSDELLKNASAKQSEENRVAIEKTEACGGIAALEDFFVKTAKAKKAKTSTALITLLLGVAAAPVGFLKLDFLPVSPLLVFLPISLLFIVLSIVFFYGSASKSKALKNKCHELGIAQSEIQDFLLRAKEAIAKRDKDDELYRVRFAERSVKERVLDSAIKKALDLFELYGIKTSDATVQSIIEKADETAKEILELCNSKDIILGKLEALKANAEALSAELKDYNEHQIRRRVSSDILEMSDAEIHTAKVNKEFYVNQLRTLGEKKLRDERALMARKYSTGNPFDIAAKLKETNEKLEVETKAHNAIALAIESITTASANLRNTIAPQIRTHANEYMRLITDGKYDSVTVTDALELSMNEDGFSYNIDAFSAGTKDAAYLALRLSLLQLTGTDDSSPLLMDETLAMIDDNRARRLLSMLENHSREHGQCILFSCHDREERLCLEEGIPFTKIEM